MPHSFGIRGRTRHLFAKKFKTNGQLALGRILVPYKVGEYVDIKGDGAVHKGMPHKFYHGKTGVVWNVTKRAIGVELNKQVQEAILSRFLRTFCITPRCADVNFRSETAS